MEAALWRAARRPLKKAAAGPSRWSPRGGGVVVTAARGLAVIGDRRPDGSGPRPEKVKKWASKKRVPRGAAAAEAMKDKVQYVRVVEEKQKDDAEVAEYKKYMASVKDALADGIEYIDDKDGSYLKQLPKAEWRDIDDVHDDFLEKDEGVPGPLTFVYLPPDKGQKRLPKPRSIQQLVAYSTQTQYVDVTESTPVVKDTVEQAWKVLRHSWHMPEEKKKKLMTKLKSTMEWAEREVAKENVFEEIFKVPLHVPEDPEELKKQAKEEAKEAKAAKQKQKW